MSRAKLMRWGVAVGAAGLVACASNRDRPGYDDYLAYASQPIDRFNFMRLESWNALGGDWLLVRTVPRGTYMIRVDGICPDLPFAQRIGLTSSVGAVSRGFDSVLVGEDRCRIGEIRSVDERRMRSERARAREEAEEQAGEPAEQPPPIDITQPVIVTAEQADQAVSLIVGQQLIVRLPADRASGRTWTAGRALEGVLTQVGDLQNGTGSATSATAAETVDTWRFLAARPGRQQLVFERHPSADAGSDGPRRISLEVTVREQPPAR